LGCCFFGCDFEKSCYGKSTRPFHVIVVTFGKASLTCEWTPRVIDCIIFFLSPRERTTGGGEDKGAHRSCCLSSTPVEPQARATPARTRPGGATAELQRDSLTVELACGPPRWDSLVCSRGRRSSAGFAVGGVRSCPDGWRSSYAASHSGIH
jgi:hypothetical protein